MGIVTALPVSPLCGTSTLCSRPWEDIDCGGNWGVCGEHLCSQRTRGARDVRRTSVWKCCSLASLCFGVFLQKAGASKGALESRGGGNSYLLPVKRDKPLCAS